MSITLYHFGLLVKSTFTVFVSQEKTIENTEVFSVIRNDRFSCMVSKGQKTMVQTIV